MLRISAYRPPRSWRLAVWMDIRSRRWRATKGESKGDCMKQARPRNRVQAGGSRVVLRVTTKTATGRLRRVNTAVETSPNREGYT